MKNNVRKVILVSVVASVLVTGCSPINKPDTSNISIDMTNIETVDDYIDFTDYVGVAKEEEVTTTEDSTTTWTKQKEEDMKTALKDCYYVNFSQTSTSGLTSEDDIYAVLNKYEVWMDIEGQDMKITNTTSESSTINNSTYILKDDKVYTYDTASASYVETDNREMIDLINITDYTNALDVVERMIGNALPKESVVGTVDADGLEHYIATSDKVNEALLVSSWTDYTQLNNQTIEFIYDNVNKKPISISILINYQKDDSSCYTRTTIDFTSIAFNGSVNIE